MIKLIAGKNNHLRSCRMFCEDWKMCCKGERGTILNQDVTVVQNSIAESRRCCVVLHLAVLPLFVLCQHQLAFETGFENASHLIKVFKQAYRLSPLQLRRRTLDICAGIQYSTFSYVLIILINYPLPFCKMARLQISRVLKYINAVNLKIPRAYNFPTGRK